MLRTRVCGEAPSILSCSATLRKLLLYERPYENCCFLSVGAGMPGGLRRCYYKTDLPPDPADIHMDWAVTLARQATLENVTLLPLIGINGNDLARGTANLTSTAETIANLLVPHSVDVWQVSDEWATPHCARIDYKTRFGMNKSDYDEGCMKNFTAALTAFITGILKVSPNATVIPVSMGWMRLGIWQWMKDEGVPLTGVGLDWYSDCGQINCTCNAYPPTAQACATNCTDILELLIGDHGLFPNVPLWITEMNRKNGACNGTDVYHHPGTPCVPSDSIGEQAQADYVKAALSEYKSLADAGHRIEGAIVYELFDQPQRAPDAESVYGMVRVTNTSARNSWMVNGTKPIFAAVRTFNTPPSPVGDS